MTKKITIAIDAMGGENSPNKTIEGVSFFIKANKAKDDYVLELYGDEKKINEELIKNNISKNSIKIVHTESVISDEETPLTAIKNGATYIIIGRPITKSRYPKKILEKINQEIKNYLLKK